jgi:hypothetical protein
MAVDGVGGGGNRFAFGLDDVSVNREKELKEGDAKKGVKAQEGAEAQKTEDADSTQSTKGPGEVSPTDIVVTVPPVQGNETSSTAKPGDGNAPLPGVDGVGSKSRSFDTDPTAAMLDDVTQAYQGMEQSIEVMYARLTQEMKSNKAELEDQIKNIDKQIDQLKEQIKKLDIILAKVTELMPKFMEMVGSDPGTNQACGGYQTTSRRKSSSSPTSSRPSSRRSASTWIRRSCARSSKACRRAARPVWRWR